MALLLSAPCTDAPASMWSLLGPAPGPRPGRLRWGDSEPGGGGGEESQGETGLQCQPAPAATVRTARAASGPQLGDGAVEANLTIEEHTEVVTNGRNGMPAGRGQLSPEREIDAVVQVRTRRARKKGV